MIVASKKRRFLQSLALYTGAAGLIAYFGFHAWGGNYGLKAKKTYTAEITKLEEELSLVKSERVKLEHKISLLSPERIDPDMLDERARAILNYAHPNDIIILNSNKK
jgi:cell division protein FtsB